MEDVFTASWAAMQRSGFRKLVLDLIIYKEFAGRQPSSWQSWGIKQGFSQKMTWQKLESSVTREGE